MFFLWKNLFFLLLRLVIILWREKFLHFSSFYADFLRLLLLVCDMYILIILFYDLFFCTKISIFYRFLFSLFPLVSHSPSLISSMPVISTPHTIDMHWNFLHHCQFAKNDLALIPLLSTPFIHIFIIFVSSMQQRGI